jgi:hypothetical protein
LAKSFMEVHKWKLLYCVKEISRFPYENLMKWSYVSLTAQIEGLAELVVHNGCFPLWNVESDSGWDFMITLSKLLYQTYFYTSALYHILH